MSERFTLTIDMGNAAFADEPATELARILRQVTQNLADRDLPAAGHRHPLGDANGNRVGSYIITN